MALIGLSYTQPVNANLTDQERKDLADALNTIITAVNSLDDSNFNTSTQIGLNKIAAGMLITAHASRHSAGGEDPLPPLSVCGGMIQPRAINASHLAKGSVLAEHLGYSQSVSGLIYFDATVLTANDGDTIEGPEGYDNWRPILTGYNVSASDLSAGMREIEVGFTADGSNFTAVCHSHLEDHGTEKKGTVSYIRVAWN